MPSPLKIRARLQGWKRARGKISMSAETGRGISSDHLPEPSSVSQPSPSSPPLRPAGEPVASSASNSQISQTRSSGPHSAGSPPQKTFQEALEQRLQVILTKKEREIFQIAQQDISADALLSKIKEFDDEYNQSSTSRRCAGTLTKVFQILDQFMKGVTIGIQASPEISSLVVGGVRLVMDIGVKFVEFFNQLTTMISRVGDYIESFALYAKAAGDIEPIKNALLHVYEDIFLFCKHARAIFVNEDGSARSAERISATAFFEAQWKPFESRFGEVEADFRHHGEVLMQSTQAVMVQSVRGIEAVQLHMMSLISATTQRQDQLKIYYEVPSLEVSQYVKRSELSKEIENAFSNIEGACLRKVVLQGMGGQGKTQLALAYCRSSRIAKTYQAIFWVDASSSDTASRGFEMIAGKLSEPGQRFDNIEAKVSFVKETLGRWEIPWLMVFDNYDNIDEFKNISDYLPPGRTGSILFTSRHAGSERLGAMIRLTRMTENESLELLLRQSKRERNAGNLAEGRDIVEKLGHLPLAIDQAGSYIRQRNLPLAQFMKHYHDRRKHILENTPPLWEYRRKLSEGQDETPLSVFTTWELSFQQISKNEHRRTLIDHFLTVNALVCENVPISELEEHIFKSYFNSMKRHSDWVELFTSDSDKTWDSYKYEDIITELANLSLVQKGATESARSNFSLHPLVAEWLRLRSDQSHSSKLSLHRDAALLAWFSAKRQIEETKQEIAQINEMIARKGWPLGQRGGPLR